MFCSKRLPNRRKSEHVYQFFVKFSPATLERYLACIATFWEFRSMEAELNRGTVEAAMMAVKVRHPDRAMRRTSSKFSVDLPSSHGRSWARHSVHR